MKISINNNTDLPNNYIRFIKWKLYAIKKKFDHLLYIELYVNKEGNNPPMYYANLRLGVEGNDIIISEKHHDPKLLMKYSSEKTNRQLRKWKEKRTY